MGGNFVSHIKETRRLLGFERRALRRILYLTRKRNVRLEKIAP
jgi:hypothetical protein